MRQWLNIILPKWWTFARVINKRWGISEAVGTSLKPNPRGASGKTAGTSVMNERKNGEKRGYAAKGSLTTWSFVRKKDRQGGFPDLPTIRQAIRSMLSIKGAGELKSPKNRIALCTASFYTNSWTSSTPRHSWSLFSWFDVVRFHITFKLIIKIFAGSC